MSASVATTYRSINLGTAHPRNTLLRAYDVGIQSLADAEQALRDGLPFDESLSRARTIVGGLMTSLDFAGEGRSIAENLLRVYLFAIDRIQTSAVEQRDAGLTEARRALETLRDGWAGAAPVEAPVERSHRLHIRG